MLQTSILNARFFTGLEKVKTGSHFFPIVPGVSMRIDTEINPGSTCIEGKHFWESETKYKKTHVTKHHSERTPKSMYDCVGWSWSFGSPSFFFSNWPCQNVQKIIEFQKYFPISAKAMPWSLWKWMGSQCIFEGIKFPNSIGYSPGQAHVTNIDPKCSFFYWAWKSENRIPFFPHCTWGVHEDGYWNQPW